MSKNNPLRKFMPENRNYRLYKAKKQWITACATVLMALGATAATQVNAQAASNNSSEAAPTAEVQTTGTSGTSGKGSANDNVSASQSAASDTASSAASQASSSASSNASSAESSSAQTNAPQSSASSVAQKKSTANSDQSTSNKVESLSHSTTSSESKASSSASSAVSSDSDSAQANSSSEAKSGSAVNAKRSAAGSKGSSAATSTSSSASNKSNASSTGSSANTNSSTASNSSDSKANSGSVAASGSAPSSATSDSAQLTIKKGKASQLAGLTTMLVEKSAKDPDPVGYDGTDGADIVYTVQGADLTNKAANFLKNGQALLKAGAKITWAAGTNLNPTVADNNGFFEANVVVTYKDGTTKTVAVSAATVADPLQLNPKSYYYVQNTGDTVDDLNTPDANGRVIYKAGDSAASIISLGGNNVPNASGDLSDVRLDAPLDTSSVGLKWATVSAKVSNYSDLWGEGPILSGDRVTIKIPYIVRTLALRTDNPTDKAGNPLINAQKYPESIKNDGKNVAVDPSASHSNQIFWLDSYYQDYDIAYAIGAAENVTVSGLSTSTVNPNQKTFTVSFGNLPNAGSQTFAVNYVNDPTTSTIYAFNGPRNATTASDKAYNNTQNYMGNRMNIATELNSNTSNVLDGVQVTLADGTKVGPSSITSNNSTTFNAGSVQSEDDDGNPSNNSAARNSGKFRVTYKAVFGKRDQDGRLYVWGDQWKPDVSNTDFIQRVLSWYSKTNYVQGRNPLSMDGSGWLTENPAQWSNVTSQVRILAPSEKAVDTKTVDVTSGPVTVDRNILKTLVKNPTSTKGIANPNQILDNNTTWPAGTQFEWINSDGTTGLMITKAGEIHTGSVKVTLGGISCTVPDVTIISRAQLKTQNKTVNYGTKLTAKDLVTNADMFPDGTTFSFVNNSEPDWNKAGDYANVQIQATYPAKITNSDGTVTNTTITTDVADAKVAINGSKISNIIKGSTVPSAGDVVNLPSTWPTHTTDWTSPTTHNNSDATNTGSITIHYPSSGLNQNITSYFNVVPKQTAINGLQFKTDGTSFDGRTNGTLSGYATDGSFLINNGGQAVTYDSYTASGTAGSQDTYTKSSQSYQPTYTIDGFSDGTYTDDSYSELAPGEHTVTIRVSVPKGTIGATTDADGNSYYTVTSQFTVAQPVQFEFVDTDENNKVVTDTNGDPITVTLEFIKGQSGAVTGLTIPNGYELADGASIPTSYTFNGDYSATDPVVQIQLKHQIIDDTNPEDTQENRTLTVNYVDAATGEEMTGLTPAQLQVHYKRTAKKDAITGTMVSHGDWFWDSSYSEDGFSNGYKVVSGTWTTPSNWANVIATVPTVNGYTAFAQGDWETVNGRTSNVAANQFVYPTWNNNGTDGNTDNGKGSLAYTSGATVYEATATHTVYFVKDQTESRTVTEHYEKLKEENGQLVDDGKAADDNQIQVFFKRSAIGFKTNGSTDRTKWVATYGNWIWNNAAGIGDASTPGFHAISGTWSTSNPTSGFSVYLPTLTGYTQARLTPDTLRSTEQWGSPTGTNADDYYISNSGDMNYTTDHTTYYVPNSVVSKTVTRTINITDPLTGRIQSIPQTYSFHREARINNSDNEIIYGVSKDGDAYNFQTGDDLWNNEANKTVVVNSDGTVTNGGTWDEQDVRKDGYTALIDGTVGTEVPAKNDVTADTPNATVNVTYIKNAANITISGPEIDETYNGSGFTVTTEMAKQISHAVTAADSHLTLPTGSDSVTLDQNDFEFVDENGNTMTTAPTNAGTYHIVLSDAGLNKFKALDPNFTWNYDPKTSYVVFKINKARPKVTFSANGSKIYDGSAIINNANFTGAPTVSFGGQAGAQNVTFQSGDFEFVGSDGTVTPAKINSTTGTVTGPINVGTYTIKLKTQGLQRIKDANPNLDLSNLTVDNIGTGTYTIKKYAPAVTISGSGQKTYDGKAVSSDDVTKQDADNNITITMTIPKEDGSGDETVVYQYNYNPNEDYTSDYTWSDNGTILKNAPKNAGTYTITLKTSGVQGILNNMLQNDPNFRYLQGNVDNSDVKISGSATYTIKQKPLTVWLSGEGGKVYDANTATMPTDLDKYLQVTGLVNGETLNTKTFDAADYQWLAKQADGTYTSISSPTDAGTYYIGILPETSTNSGVDTLIRDNTNYKLTIDYTKHYTYNIAKADGTVTLNGSQSDVYSGGSHAVAEYSLIITGPGVTSADDQGQLQDGDLEFLVDGKWTTTVPMNVGTYQVKLSDSATQFLTDHFKNLNLSYVKGATYKDYQVTPSPVTVTFSGDSQKTYDGSPISIDYTNANFQSHFTVNGLVAGYTLKYQDAKSDLFEWVDDKGNVLSTVPATVGTYYLKLKNLDAVNKLNPNYSFSFTNDGNGWKWTINKATATIDFAANSGSQTTAWTGQPTVLDPSNFAVAITTNNGQTLTATGLTADDFDFYQNGQKIGTPTEIGDYTVKLNADGLAKIEEDTTNYTWTDNALGTYHITKAAATINLNGSSSTTYNGQVAVIPTNGDGSVKGITVTLSNGKTYTLKASDLQFTDADGSQVQTPIDAGNYYVSLSQIGLDNISKLDGTHYDYSLASPKAVKFAINKAEFTVNLSGSGTSTYDGNTADLSKGNYTMQLPEQSATTVDAGDLVFVDAGGNEITAPSDADTYKVALSKSEQKALQKQFDKNYNLTFTSDGSFTIDPKTVDLILNGTLSQTYNGQPAKITNIPKNSITLTWGDHTTTTAPGGVTFNLTPDDLTVLDTQDTSGKVPTDANSQDPDAHPYYIHLKDSVLAGLNNQNKNYRFEIGTTYARYTIYAYQSNLTLTGKQFVNYGTNTMPPLSITDGNFKLTWTDVDGTTHTFKNLPVSDLEVVVPTGEPADDNGMPVNAGQYVVKVKDSVIENWNETHPNYKLVSTVIKGSTGSDVTGTSDKTENQPQANSNAWYVVVHRQVGITINNTPSVTYNGQPATIKDGDYTISFTPVTGVANSGQAARDSAAFKSFKLTAADLEFVNGTPTNVGTYQVQLSAQGLKDLQNFANDTLSGNYDFSSVITADANGNFTSSSATASYTIKQMPLTVHLSGNLSHQMGDYTLPVDGNYTLTITTQDGEIVKDASGKPITFTYTLKDGDVVYKNGIPNKVGGPYGVVLSPDALSKIEDQYGTSNYTYTSTSDAKFNVTQGTGKLTVTGSQTVPYTGKAATLDDSQYTLVLHTNVGDITLPLTGASASVGLGFYQEVAKDKWKKVDNPTNVGTYVVGIDPAYFGTLEETAGGTNYKWTQVFDAKYTITAINGMVTANYTNNRDYNGKAIGELSIPVSLTYSSTTTAPTTYTLQKGDYELVGPNGTVYTDPTAAGTANAGTYTIKLTQQGKDYINQHFGNVADTSGKITSQNVNWTYGDTLGTYTINPVRMMVTVSGDQTTTYDGSAYGADDSGKDADLLIPTITLGTQDAKDQGITAPTIPTTGENALTADDFTITQFADPTKVVTTPTNAGHYRVYLNSKGFAKLAALSPNFTYPTSVTSYGLLTINPKLVTVKEGMASKTFNAQTSALTDDQFADYKNAISSAGYSAEGLTTDDIDWWFDTNHFDYGTQGHPTNPIKDVGTYCLRLNEKGQEILAKNNPNYNIKVDAFVYHIYPEVVHIGINQGPQNVDWNNQAVTVDPTVFTPTFTVYGGVQGTDLIGTPVRDDGQTLTIPEGVNLGPGDYEFVDDHGNVIKTFTRADGTTTTTPFKVGTYHVRLTEAGWKKLATQSTDNVRYQYGDGAVIVTTPTNTIGSLSIQQVTPAIILNGGNWKVYDGQPASFDQTIYENGKSNGRQLINATFTVNGQTITLPLSADDFIWSSNGQNLKAAPSTVGIYGICLNKTKFISDVTAWVAQHPDYAGAMELLSDNISGSASYEIKALGIDKIVAQPDHGSAVYNGQEAQIDLNDLAGKIHATDANDKVWTLSTNGLTLADFNDASGHAYADFPLNVGTYTFTLNSDGINVIKTNNPNFTFPDKVSNYSYIFTITPAEATAKLSGTAEKTYDGQQATTTEINGGTSTIAVSIGANKTIYYTLQDGV